MGVVPNTPSSLTPKQIELLNWVRSGCPGGVYEGYAHRTSARALASKGLLKVKGHGAEWTATLTDAGRNWQPGQPAPRQAAGRTRAAPSPVVGKRAPDTRPASADGPAPRNKEHAAELVQRVIDAGGHLPIEGGYESMRLHEDLVRVSIWAENRPRGKKLEIVHVGPGWQTTPEIAFTDHFVDLVELQPVPVPDHVSRYSPTVRAYLDDKDWHYVSSDHLSRAARIIEAIVREAPNRGLQVLPPETGDKRRTMRATAETKQHVSLAVGDSTYHVQVREISAPGGGRPTRPYYDARKKPPAWTYERQTSFISTGRLELVVRGRFAGYTGDVYRDTTRTTVEEKLPRIFQSLEVYRLEAGARAEKQRLREEARRRREEAALAEARERYDEHARWEHFKKNSQEWQRINSHREFLVAARVAVADYEGGDKEAIVAQLDVAQRTLDELDPLRRPQLLAPVVPEPTNADLKPFLGGRGFDWPGGF